VKAVHLRIVLIMILICKSFKSFDQRTIDVTKTDVKFTEMVQGIPIGLPKFTELINGSPWFNNNWMVSKVIMNDSTEYAGKLIKIDLLRKQVHYLDSAETEFIMNGPIDKIILFDQPARRNYEFIPSSQFKDLEGDPQYGWYQLLADGKARLLKQIKKSLHEYRPYGSATDEQEIITKEFFFIVNNGKFIWIKKMSQLSEILKDKWDQLKEYKSRNKISNAVNEENLAAMVKYYNQIIRIGQ